LKNGGLLPRERSFCDSLNPNTKTDQTARAPNSADVAALVATKLRCIAPMIAVYLTAYVGLSILSGFAKPLLGTKVLGPVNLGFTLIALNYLVGWVLAVIYARVANRVYDPLVQTIIAKAEHEGGVVSGITIGIFAAILALNLRDHGVGSAAHPHGDRFLRGGQGSHGSTKRLRAGR
jgi:uncharacterized membrane protein (DUF485 family)